MLANPAFTSSLQAELVATLPDADRVIPRIASIKRFVERWLADDQLRREFQSDPAATARHYSVPVGLREFLLEQKPLTQADHPALLGYEVYLRQRAEHRARMRQECTPTSEPFKAWRERQIKRCQRQLPQHYNDAIMHLPVAFELCQGCSVGCWFCGLSAARLESVFEATEANRALWRETLEAIRDVAGPSAGRGIAFWATDPLDNPDYEQLCQDFRDILGRFPATTTALGPKDLERTGRLLEQAWANGCEFNRFSILSLSQMDKITEHFSPEALLYVDLIAQTKGALRAKALAGKALDKIRPPSPVSDDPSTIACVSGFLITMPTRTVRLVSPCAASERWPMGYRVHATAKFSSGDDLRSLTARMIGKVMTDSPDRDKPVRLIPQTPAVFGRDLGNGQYTVGELALMRESTGIPMARTFHTLQQLFDEGCIDDEPEGDEYD